MANNKDFIVKSDIEATNIIEGLGTVSAGTKGPSGLFNVSTWTGTGSSQTITTNLDLTGSNEGLVWIRKRSNAEQSYMYDTVRGVTKDLHSSNANAESTRVQGLTAFTSSGFTLGTANGENQSGHTFVSWNWKSSANFFDVVTYSGSGSAQAIAHNLGSVPGMIMIKGRSGTESDHNWAVYHRGNTAAPETDYLILNDTAATADNASWWNDTAPTSTHFTVGAADETNEGSTEYVAYLFAHNTDTINCGSYTGNGSASGPTVTTGFKPQWILVKDSSASSNWTVLDSTRGLTSSSNKELMVNLTNAEGDVGYFTPTANGFTVRQASYYPNASGNSYVFVAIAEEVTTSNLDLSTGSVFNFTPTSNTQVTLTNPAASGTVSQATLVYNSQDPNGVSDKFAAVAYSGNGASQTITTNTDLSGDGGLIWIKQRGGTDGHALINTDQGAAKTLQSESAGASADNSSKNIAFTSSGFSMNTNDGQFNNSSATYVAWTWKKAPGFFDVVTYTGNGTAGRTIPHNLGTVPGFIIVKRHNGSDNWTCYHRGANGGSSPEDYTLYLNTDEAQVNQDLWADTAPTSSVFSVGDNVKVNGGASNEYVAYLFSHSDTGGPISCGHYTGNSNATGPEINVGFEPQFVMIKRADAAGPHWNVYDNARGVSTSGNDKQLEWNNNTAEADAQRLKFTATGFQLTVDTGQVNGPGSSIYMAIAAEGAITTTYNNTIDWPGGTAPTSPALGETDVLTFSTSYGGATYKAVHAIDGAK